VQHADDGYSRRGHIGGSRVYGMFLMYTCQMAPTSRSKRCGI